MAGSAEVIVLSSSPNPPPRSPIEAVRGTKDSVDILPRQESPPPLPSPSDLFDRPLHSRFFPAPLARDFPTQKKPRRTTKSTAAASIRGNALEQPIPRTESKEMETASPRNLVPKTQDPLYKEAKKKTARKTRTTTGNKKNEMSNMTLTGKVTKGRNDIQSKEPSKKRKKTTILKEKRDEPPNPTALEGSEAGTNHDELSLDEALRRRIDWTPVRDTAPNSEPTMEENEEDRRPSQPIPEEFDKLISNYNYSGASSAAHEALQNLGGEGPTKRRRIELVNPLLQQFQPQHADSNEEMSKQDNDLSMPGPQSKKKSKGPKRLTTLTARMTAQYSLTNTKDLDSASGGLDISTTRKANIERGKGQNEAMFNVLSPKDAFQSLDDQDLVFGTCSQLEREDSPQTTGEMQQAIRAPENLSLVERKQDIPSKTIAKEPMSYRPGTRNLWRVAARNTEGSLVQAQMTSGVSLQSSSALASKGQNVKAKGSLNWEDEDWFELDYGKPYTSPKKKTPLPKTSARPVPPSSSEVPGPAEEGSEKTTSPQDKTAQEPQMPHYSGFTDAELTKQIGTFGFKSIRGRKKMIELLEKCWESKHGSINKTGILQAHLSPPTDIVELSSSTQAQLHDPAPESGSQKKAARRNGQSKKDTTTAPNSSIYPTPTTIHTNKPTSRSRMEAPKGSERSSQTYTSSSFINVEEIQDSEDETVPPPNQVLLSTSSDFVSVSSFDIKPKELNAGPTKQNRKSKKYSASTSGNSDRPFPSKRSSLPNLATQITKAVRSQHLLSPLSTLSGSRNRPTWHEKILMYDPVILEDFTTWLNIEGLGLVGEDREVHVAAAREWCENKGVCCCWKNNAGVS